MRESVVMTNETRQSRSALLQAATNLFPGYFAVVMATGIISIVAHLLQMRTAALALLVIKVVAYLVLWALLGARVILFFPRIEEDIADHAWSKILYCRGVWTPLSTSIRIQH